MAYFLNIRQNIYNYMHEIYKSYVFNCYIFLLLRKTTLVINFKITFLL